MTRKRPVSLPKILRASNRYYTNCSECEYASLSELFVGLALHILIQACFYVTFSEKSGHIKLLVLLGLKSGSVAKVALCYFSIYCIFTPSRHMVLTRFPTLTGLVSTPPVLHPCFSLASSASCDAFTEQQTSFMEPGPSSTQARSSLGKEKAQRF